MRTLKLPTGGVLGSIGILTIANGVNAVLAFGASVIAARVLEPSDFGKISVLMATSMFLSLSLDFGMNQILTRRVAVRTRTRLYRDVFRTRAYIALAVTAAGAVVLARAGSTASAAIGSDAGASTLLAVSAAWQLVFTTEQAFLQGVQRFRALALQIVAVNALRFVFVAASGRTPTFEAFLLAYTMPAVVSGLYSAVRRRSFLFGNVRWRLVRSLLPVIGLAGIAVCLTSLLSRISLWAVASLAGHAQAASYAVAFQTASLVFTFGTAMALCIVPHVAQLDRDGQVHAFLTSYLRKAIPVAAALAVAAAGFAAIVPVLFGARYRGTETITFLLMLSFILSVLNSPFYVLQQSRFRFGFLVVVHVVQAVLLAAGCIVLVPRWTGTGAAVAEVVVRVVTVTFLIAAGIAEARKPSRALLGDAAEVEPGPVRRSA